ncbi:acetyl-CoA C-acetyltransferase [Endozoicomonas sp.]|uniref:acetyl-CoA C-acetyltransferase n=1 Tax=Endozoicomonas sp. TaxID=1892382 RepID=UPI00383B56CB
MQDVVIVSAARTPIGIFNGVLATVTPARLGIAAAKGVLEKAGVKAEDVQELVLGNVLGAGQGMNIARQIALGIGMSTESTAYNVSKVCGSGMKAVVLAAQAIACGDIEIALAGGSENMSQSPYVLPKARWGQRMGHGQLLDTMISDGLTDAFNDYHMGITAENLAERYHISRKAQDEYAARSQERALAAQDAHRFADEIVPVEVVDRKQTVIVDKDEGPRVTSVEKLAKLRTAFSKGGTVTAGNASTINDGAAMLLLMSRSKAESLGLQPMVVIKSSASAGVSPEVMGYGPVPATKKALSRAGLSVADIDLVEANEAFAVQALSVVEGLELDPEKTNVNGGAVALGHPIGASGARILVTLLHEMAKRDVRYGLATLCIGGGMGIAMVVERE